MCVYVTEVLEGMCSRLRNITDVCSLSGNGARENEVLGQVPEAICLVLVLSVHIIEGAIQDGSSQENGV